MKRFLYKTLYPIARIYWFISRPKTVGVKCILKKDNSILMIRNAYTRINQWTFPGGGVKKGESLEEAVVREILEEVGIDIYRPKKFGEFLTTQEHKRDTVHCFSVITDNQQIHIDKSEIQEARWFSLDAIPKSLSPSVIKILELFQNKVN